METVMEHDEPPRDLDEEEEMELYQLFGELRREIQDIVGSLTDVVLNRIEVLQVDDERLQQPNFLDMLSTSLSSFVNIVTAWNEELDDPPKNDDEEE